MLKQGGLNIISPALRFLPATPTHSEDTMTTCSLGAPVQGAQVVEVKDSSDLQCQGSRKQEENSPSTLQW